jgi:two-component system sensor histidine kinase RegB
MPTPQVAPAPNITLSWLLRLRWIAVAGQLFTVAVVSLGLGLRLPVTALVSVVGLTALSNLALDRWLRSGREVAPRVIASVLVLDTLLLTAMLFLTGGPANPFSALYLLHVTLAAIMLGARWGWQVMALSTACFALLFLVHEPLADDVLTMSVWDLHLRGSWIAFVVAAAVTAYFVSRITEELKAREQELQEAQAQGARNEKLASLSTLAAGAAHELGTPLATIAVVAKELERSAQAMTEGAGMAEDLRLIREQVERCRLILVQMSAKAGESAGELPGPVPIATLFAEVQATLSAERSARLVLASAPGLHTVLVPKQALVLVLASLLRNAFDASDERGRVRLEVGREGGRVRFTVRDEGHGMAPEVLSRAGDPFFTTKPTGRGTGLGLFLARAFVERLGGALQLTSEPGAGTTAALELPQETTR